MTDTPVHPEHHFVHRIGWLRAAVLGANDGIVSIGSLIVGVASATPDNRAILLAGAAGLVAGAMSMAAGEYVSVSSQSDTERADLAKERTALAARPGEELEELAGIYRARGLGPELAREVAQGLMEHDALGAHARDELGLTEVHAARPLQAALASAATFTLGAAVPLAAAVLSPAAWALWAVSAVSLVCLAALGALSARTGGAPVLRAVWRVTIWGAFAIALTAVVGRLVGTVV